MGTQLSSSSPRPTPTHSQIVRMAPSSARGGSGCASRGYHPAMTEPLSSIICPFCRHATGISAAPLRTSGGVAPNLGVRSGHMARYDDELFAYRPGRSVWIVAVCHTCSGALLVDLGESGEVYPDPLPPPVATEIPAAIRSDLEEALQCLYSGAFNASVMMSRRALQTAAGELGASAGDHLHVQIQGLRDEGVITKDQAEWAFAVKYIGNDSAHPDAHRDENGVLVVRGATEEDAKLAAELVESLLNSMYTARSKARAALASRGLNPEDL